MKLKFKKSLVALLAVAMLMTSFASVGYSATPSDVVGTSSAAAVTRLIGLGVVKGYEDGTFKPANKVTRAEFAAIAVRMLGLESAANIAAGPTKFSDVKADHWASGYVNVAAAKGLLTGYPDGSFKADANVTYAESLAIIIRALGYQPLVVGPWPTNYISKAVELNLLGSLSFKAGDAAARGDLAIMTDKGVMDVKLVTAEEYSDKVVYKISTETLASKTFKVTEDTAVVTVVPATSTSLDANKFTAGANTYTLLAGVVSDVNALLGYKVKVGYKDSDRAKTLYVNLHADDNKTVAGTLAATAIAGGTAKIKVGTSTTSTDYKVASTWAGNAETVRNSRLNDTAWAVDDSVTAFLNNAGEIRFVIAKRFDATHGSAVVTKVDIKDVAGATANRLTIKDRGTTVTNTVALSNDLKGVSITRDGKAAKLADIAKDDIARITKDNAGAVTSVEATSTRVTGSVSSASSDGTKYTVVIDGKTYELSTGATYKVGDGAETTDLTGLPAAASGKSVQLSLDGAGKARFVAISPALNTVSGLVLEATDNKGFVEGSVIKNRDVVKVVTAANEVKEVLMKDGKFFGTDSTGPVAAPAKGTSVSINLGSDGFGTSLTTRTLTTGAVLADVDSTNRTITVGTNVFYFNSETAVFDYSAGSNPVGSSINAIAKNLTVSYRLDGLTVKELVINKSTEQYGVVSKTDYTVIEADGTTKNLVDILTKDGVRTYTRGSGVNLTTKGQFVRFKLDAGVLPSADTSTSAATGAELTVNGTVYNLSTTTNTFDLGVTTITYAHVPTTMVIKAKAGEDPSLGAFGDVVNGKTVDVYTTAPTTLPRPLRIIIVRN